jgi:hypothetical protein
MGRPNLPHESTIEKENTYYLYASLIPLDWRIHAG